MYVPDEVERIVRRFAADPKGEAIRMAIGLCFIVLSLPVLHLFLKGTHALANILNSL